MLREVAFAEGGRELGPAAVTLERCREYIEDHLSDPGLSPVRVAEANFISTRYLHLLFEQAETTVAAYIRTRRLDRIQEALADPQLAHVPVEALARRFGFENTSYFGQVFKRDTGLTPARYRAEALA